MVEYLAILVTTVSMNLPGFNPISVDAKSPPMTMQECNIAAIHKTAEILGDQRMAIGNVDERVSCVPVLAVNAKQMVKPLAMTPIPRDAHEACRENFQAERLIKGQPSVLNPPECQ
jgi:hypothetical protein